MTTQSTTPTTPATGGAGHAESLSEILASYAEGGFDAEFSVTPDARLECHACGIKSDPAEVAMSSLRRLEGASDPDDMVAVVGLACPSCGAHGTVTLGYGPMAQAEHSDVLHEFRDHRGDSKSPGNSAPGETTGDDTPRK